VNHEGTENELSFALSMENSLIHISHLERQKKAQLSCDGSRKVSISSVTPFRMAFETTYPWQLGYHNSHQSQKIDDEICQIVMRVVSTE
jgi:hypothetical protein